MRWLQLLAVLVVVSVFACDNNSNDLLAPATSKGPVYAMGSDPVTGATIETDQDDYLPGEIIHLIGSGWAANETVHLDMTEDPDTHGDVAEDVQADSAGAFNIRFYDVQEHDLGVEFTLTGTGNTSGSVVTVRFTDGRAIATLTLNGSAAVTVASAASISANASGALTGNNNNTLGSIGIKAFVHGANPNTAVQLTCSDVSPDLGPASPSNQIPFSHTFSFNAPSTGAVYDVIVTSYQDNACAATAGAFSLTLSNAITVQSQANQSISFGPLANKTFGNAAFSVSATATSGLPVSFSSTTATTCSVAGSTVTILHAGSCTVRASQGGNASFNPAADVDQTFTIARADANIVVTGHSGTFDGAAHGATGSATGVNGENLSGLLSLGVSFTNAPGGNAFWTFAGTADYNGAGGAVAIVINQASASITVSGYTGMYDGLAHGATGSATGVNGENLNTLLNLGASFTNAPGGLANWAFAGNTNYTAASGSVAISIGKIDAQISVTGYSGTYDGAEHGATGSATGLNGDNLNGLLDLGAKFINAPGGTATWSFAGNTNYNGASGSVAITIAKIDAQINVTGYSDTYDGAPHGATGTATGVSGENLVTLFLTLGATFTHVPGGTAHWTFAGNDNYNAASGSVAITIARATATIGVDGYSGMYDGAAHGATGTATGVLGESLNSHLSLGSSFTHVSGGTAHWSFSGAGDYNDASGDAGIVIGPKSVTATIAAADKVYNGSAAATITSCDVIGTLGADQVDCTTSGAAFDDANAGDNKPVSATVSLSGAASGDYTLGLNTGASTTASISRKPVTATITAADKTYDGNTTADITSCTVNGKVGSDDVDCSASGGTFSDANAADGKAVSAGVSLNGSAAGNYSLGVNTSAFTTASISRKTVTATIVAADKTYDGSATATITECTVHGTIGSDQVDCSTSGAAFDNANAGQHKPVGATVSLSGPASGNYTLGTDTGANTTASISQKSVTATITASDKTYDGNASAGITSCAVNGTVGTDDVSCTASGGAFASAHAGDNQDVSATVSLGGAASGNYTLGANTTAHTTASIHKAPLTVTADNQQKTYNGAAYSPFTATITGFVNGEGVSVLSGSPAVGGNAVGAVNAGSYTITPYQGSLSAANYAFATYTSGMLTINKATLTVTADNKAKVFDNAPYSPFSATLSGFVNGENASVVTGAAGYTGAAVGAMMPGSYAITPTAGTLNATNYALTTFHNGTLTIISWTLTGFYQPVDMPNPTIIWNTVKGGSTVPLKFEIFSGSVERSDVGSVKSFTQAKVACDATAPTDDLEFTTTGGTSLRYDATAGQFIQNWQTPKLPGQCYMVTMTTQDNSKLVAFFKLK